MKPLSIKYLLLVAALLTPSLRAQDAPAKIHEIEQKVLLKRYQDAVQALIQSAREFESDSSGSSPDILGKRLQWLTVMDDQIEGEDKIAGLDQGEMEESAGTLNDLAWNMVISPDASDCHPEIALKLSDIAIELGGEDEALKPKMLDTKARALFLLGKRDEAIAEQEKAVAAATVAIEKAGFEAALAAYRRNELLEVIPASGEGEAITTDVSSEPQDLQSRMEEIAVLRKRITDLVKESARVSSPEIDRLKDDLRARMAEVEELSKKKEPEVQGGPSSGVSYIVQKLRTIVIPTIAFENVTLEEAVDFLRKRSVELDTTEPDPGRKGVNMVVRLPVGSSGPSSGEGTGGADAIRIKSLQLRNVPLSEALRYICGATRFRYKVDDFAVTLVSSDMPEDLFTRTFSVPPDFGSALVPIQDLLKMCGIKFGEGASAVLPSSGTLMVVNTPSELDKIEVLIEATNNARAGAKKSDRLAPGAVAPPPVEQGGR